MPILPGDRQTGRRRSVSGVGQKGTTMTNYNAAMNSPADERHDKQAPRQGAAQASGSDAEVAARCSPATADRPPNLLFVFPDQWRRQALGVLGEDPVATPWLDRFAEESLLFTNALCTTPLCVPARAALLTGRYPLSNGVPHNGCRLPDDEVTIAEVLGAAGYATGYIGKWHLDGRHHGDQFVPVARRHGFDFWYANNMVHHHYLTEYYTGEATHVRAEGWTPDHETDVAINYIREHAARPFALFLAWTPPHPGRDRQGRQGYLAPDQYEAPYRHLATTGRQNFAPTYDGGQASAANLPGYFGAITSLDEQFGRLLACLDEEGLAERTIVVFHADHGEMLGSHGLMGKHIWYEEAVGVPFIIRWPGRIRPGRADALFNQVDIVPSLLGLMGHTIPAAVEGADFSPLMLGSDMSAPDSALLCFFNEFDAARHSNWRCLRTQRYSYVVAENNGTVESIMYDLQSDPYQLTPMRFGEGHDDVMTRLDKALHVWLVKIGDPFEAWLVSQPTEEESHAGDSR